VNHKFGKLVPISESYRHCQNLAEFSDGRSSTNQIPPVWPYSWRRAGCNSAAKQE